MKMIIISSLALILAMVGMVEAGLYTLQPPPSPNHDLWDLDHYKYYAWKITSSQFNPPSDEIIIGAGLFFDNIENWNNQPNSLYISLLSGNDLSFAGEVFTGTDNASGGDDVLTRFDGAALVTFKDLPDWPQDLVYNFTADDINMLNAYAGDGVFGVGFDPDCHYWNDSIVLAIQTIPEPATCLLLGLGVLMAKRRKRR
ncbi:MAG: PEP-CTERM sorting domain-containing protein [Sedimentisphaerales bacterium]